MPAFIVNITSSTGSVIMRQPGETCNNHRGYCDDKQVCVATHNGSDLWGDSVKSMNILTPNQPVMSPSNWLLTNWYAIGLHIIY